MAEESMTSTTAQTDSDLEVPLGEVPPFRISMNPILLKSARTGDKRILDGLLRPRDFSSGASVGEIAIIVREDAPTQEDTRCLLGVTLEGNTALHIVASRGHFEIAKEICRREISLLAAPNTRLDTPLHCAARAGYDQIVSLIIHSAREGEIEERRVLRARNRDEANALHEAAKYNHASVAEVLMDADARLPPMPNDDRLASMLNDAGMSPLYLAIAIESLDVAKALLRSSSWDWENPSLESYAGPNKKTALHAAVLLSREITRVLLDRKPMLAKGVDSSGGIPLHYAALDGHHDTVKLLLKRDPSTAYQPDANGSFSIHMAARRGNVRILNQILEQCPDTDELLDGRGRNFLQVAFQWGNLYAVKKIISKRPDLRKLLNDQDNEGNTPLHTAVKNSDKASMHFLLRDKTVSVNVINHDGFTPLDLAYGMLDEGQLQFWTNSKFCIASCLALTKALPSPRELHDLESGKLSSDETKEKLSGEDKFKKKSSNVEGNAIGRRIEFAKNIGIVMVLIATVTFAAAFTVPGGYIQDDHPGRGTAVLAKEYAFNVFLVSDAAAMVSSMLATVWLIHSGISTIDTRHRLEVLGGALVCLWVAFAGMSTAFAMGIYVVLPLNHNGIGVLLCVFAGVVPIHGYLVPNYSFYTFLKTVIIRQGYRKCIWPTTHLHDKKHFDPYWLTCAHLISFLVMAFGPNALFFLLAAAL